MRHGMESRLIATLAALALAGCATIKPPTLQVQKVGMAKVGITGAKLNVGFGVRNPNPDDLNVEKMEYELILNGQRIGRGYASEPFSLRGFAEVRVASTVDVGLLTLPSAVKRVLADDRVKAQAKGTFYVRRGDGLKKISFDSEATVDLDRE
jgi:LEA14-like dessication related protein